MSFGHTDPLGTNNAAYAVSETAYATYPHPAIHNYAQALEQDFYGPLIANGVLYGPWVVTNIGTPTYAVGTAPVNHPGVMRATSQASANTGCMIQLAATQIVPGGGESSEFVFNVLTTTTFMGYMGFMVFNTYNQPTIGAWINIAATTLTGVVGNGSITATGTSYTISAATWYRAIVQNNAGNTSWTFTLYACAAPTTVLWQNSCSGANIPAQLLSHGVVEANSGGSAVTLMDLDYMNLNIANALTR